MSTQRKPLPERILEAELRGSQSLADGNEARECGDKSKAEECYQRSQYWLDRYNHSTERGDKQPPKE